jgi:hypothetical protein
MAAPGDEERRSRLQVPSPLMKPKERKKKKKKKNLPFLFLKRHRKLLNDGVCSPAGRFVELLLQDGFG